MGWEGILAMVVAAPLILAPVAFIWYLNAGGIFAANKQTSKAKAAQAEGQA
jgi:hypothetical protein